MKTLSLCLLTAVAAVSAAAPNGGIKCKLEQVKDTDRTGMVAYTYFVPAGWQAKPSFRWNGNTYIAELAATSVNDTYGVDQLEPVATTYSASNGSVQGLRLTKATDFLHALISQMEKNGKAAGVRIVEESNQDLPLSETQMLMRNSRQIGGMHQNQFRQSAYMKVTFDRNGVQEVANMETTVAGMVQSNNMQLGIGSTARQYSSESGSYVIGPTVIVTVPQNASPAKVKEAQIVASSARMTPQFIEYCVKLALAMSSASLKATEDRGKELRKEMAEEGEKRMEEFKQKWAQNDANTHDFCNFLLDQQDYHDPSGSIVTLPNAYNHAWSNGDGDYILSSDPTFDPRGSGDGNWQQMQKAEHGQ